MKILIMGTGAVGSFYGGKLARAGHKVIFVARGENLSALRQKGLSLQSIQGDFHLDHVDATDQPASAGVCDLVLVCVKSYDSMQAAQLLRPVVGPETVILSLQNGVENEDLFAHIFGTPHVMGGMAYIGAELTKPGVVIHSAAGHIVFGELSGERTARAERLQQLFLAAGISAQLSTNIMTVLWDKLVWNTAFNAITT